MNKTGDVRREHFDQLTRIRTYVRRFCRNAVTNFKAWWCLGLLASWKPSTSFSVSHHLMFGMLLTNSSIIFRHNLHINLERLHRIQTVLHSQLFALDLGNATCGGGLSNAFPEHRDYIHRESPTGMFTFIIVVRRMEHLPAQFLLFCTFPDCHDRSETKPLSTLRAGPW